MNVTQLLNKNLKGEWSYNRRKQRWDLTSKIPMVMMASVVRWKTTYDLYVIPDIGMPHHWPLPPDRKGRPTFDKVSPGWRKEPDDN